MCSLYMAASFWHPSSPRMFSLEVSLITISTFATKKPRGHIAPNDPHGKLRAAELMCYFQWKFSHIYFLFSTPAGNYSNNQTGTDVTVLLCKVMSSFLKLTATLVTVMMFMWREKKRSSGDERKHDSHFASYTKFSNSDRMQCNFSKKNKKNAAIETLFGRLKVGIRCSKLTFLELSVTLSPDKNVANTRLCQGLKAISSDNVCAGQRWCAPEVWLGLGN